MASREFISGFLMGFGISSIFHGLYLMYVGNKLIQLSKSMNATEVIELNDINNNCDNTSDITSDID